MTNMILSKGMSTAIVIAFFGAIIWLLRFLYGPKGIFRDPEWDRWNEEARREEEQRKKSELPLASVGSEATATAPSPISGIRPTPVTVIGTTTALSPDSDNLCVSALETSFLAYAQGFLNGKDDEPILLKREHTLNVLANARAITEQEDAFTDSNTARAALIAALLHDVGRFEQYRRYHTFADDISCNHGTLGAKTIRQQGFLANERREIARLAITAVAAHNRYAIPAAIKEPLLSVLSAVRDADKLDIVRVLREHLRPGTPLDPVIMLSLQDIPTAYTPAILKALEQGKTALYKDMRFINDFRILLCTWTSDFHFPTSLRLLNVAGHLEAIIDGLEGIPDVQTKVRAIVAARLQGV